MEQILTVGLGDRSYPIYIGSGIMPRLGQYLRERLHSRRYAIISDHKVEALYGEQVLQSLRAAGLEGELFSFPAGEASKELATIAQLASTMAQRNFDRADAIVALGGGVSGDMAGFLAAIYMRGIPFVQVPTTLLAQVDSSVGGKTGVDIPEGKNLIGAFYQPRLVLIDTDVLQTLPQDEFLGGMGEVIKYGASLDADFFHYLEAQQEKILAQDRACLNHVIHHCCTLKAKVVEQDEREGGLRRVLNFGHTIGHAVEAASDYSLLHGFAVAIGMCAVTELAERCGYASAGLRREIATLLTVYGLPADIPPKLDRARIRRFMLTDKKSVGRRLFFVLPVELGKVMVTDQIDATALDKVLAAS
ncbi:MAG: 3-dehydroquinate synthase [Desulfobulbaceae bacterium]|nr:3-dehydroquinate synthase [Desulfobulbaceae bacterium]